MSKTKKIFQDVLWDNKVLKIFSGSQLSIPEVLKSNPMFEDFSKGELKLISKIAYERSYNQGEFIFTMGQPGAAMFIILVGEVQIMRLSDEGTEVELARLRDGETLGELALLDDSPRSATARVIKPTKVLALFREDLVNFLSVKPELGGKIVKKLAVITGYRLRMTNDLLLEKQSELEECRKKLAEEKND
jgi:CRP-like cAMP-binding protein